MKKVLEQATKVLCLAEEACDKTRKGDWQPCAYQRYRWRMDQEIGHLYALFGGPEEDEVRIKGQRLAKAWLATAHDSVEGARKHMGLQLRRASKLNVAQQCQHDGLPAESWPCEGQAQAAIQRADCSWESGPRRMQELCGEYPDRGGWPTGGTIPVKAPGGGSEFSPGHMDSESDTDSSDSSDWDSSDPETGDSEPSEAETEVCEPSARTSWKPRGGRCRRDSPGGQATTSGSGREGSRHSTGCEGWPSTSEPDGKASRRSKAEEAAQSRGSGMES
jgi:hypothetical protein